MSPAPTIRPHSDSSCGSCCCCGVIETVNDPVATLPAASAAAHVTTVSPMANVLPDAGVQFTVGLGVTASDAVAVNVTALPAGEVASSVIVAGRLRVGRVVSRTVTVNDACDRLP